MQTTFTFTSLLAGTAAVAADKLDASAIQQLLQEERLSDAPEIEPLRPMQKLLGALA